PAGDASGARADQRDYWRTSSAQRTGRVDRGGGESRGGGLGRLLPGRQLGAQVSRRGPLRGRATDTGCGQEVQARSTHSRALTLGVAGQAGGVLADWDRQVGHGNAESGALKDLGKPCAGKRHARLCVQRRLARSAGDRPAGVTARSPVAWMAEMRETEFL